MGAGKVIQRKPCHQRQTETEVLFVPFLAHFLQIFIVNSVKNSLKATYELFYTAINNMYNFLHILP